MKTILLVCLLLGTCEAVRLHQREKNAANPIRKVVTMMQQMLEKVKAEGEREQELVEKFLCYCKNGKGDLLKSIADAEIKIPQTASAIKEFGAKTEQTIAELAQHKKDRAEAEQSLAEADSIRQKEAAAFAQTESDLKTNLEAMGKAIAALEKGMAGGFLQTSAASVLRDLTVKMELSNVDRDALASFLSTGSDAGYAPASGQITGILKQMKDSMETELADATAAEEKAIAGFAGMKAAKLKEVEALTKAIEKKTAAIGDSGVQLVEMKQDLKETEKALIDDQKFLADLEKSCDTRAAEWEVRKKTRNQEILALRDTIKILNDDDALELFKKTLPSASLLLVELRVNSKQVRNKVISALSHHHDARIDLISMAMKGKKVDFSKVNLMIDEMVGVLGKEQKDDDKKLAFCRKELDTTEDNIKVLNHDIGDLDKAIASKTENIKTLTEELKALAESIKALDKAVDEQTENRKEENEEYKTLDAQNNAAIQLLGIAKNRMNKFYNPNQYEEPPARELTEEERISGIHDPTDAPGGIAGTGVTVLAQAAPGEAPELGWKEGESYKKSDASSGCLAMMDMLVADLKKELQEAKVEEDDAQSTYEAFMADSKRQREDAVSSIAEKEAAKADAETGLLADQDGLAGKKKELNTEVEKGAALHQDCDWLIKNFAARKEARAGEVESLKNAKAVLAGADFE